MAIDKTKILDSTENKYVKELLQEYKASRGWIKMQIADLEEKGKLTLAEMNSKNRLVALNNSIQSEITKLQIKTGEIIKDELFDLYENSYYLESFGIQSAAKANLSYAVLPTKQIEAAIKNPYDMIGFINRNKDNCAVMAKQIQQAITTGLIQGSSYSDIANVINDRFDIGAGSAERIARTEGHRARETGSNDSAREAEAMGVKLKRKWIASLDANTRPAHQEADNQEVGINEPFTVDGEELMYPGAPGGSAENVINCRCSTVTIVNGLSPKLRSSQDGYIPYKSYKEWQSSLPKKGG